MRMSREDSVSARDIVNGCSQRELARILYEYGEERRADKIAYQICRAREKAPIETTFQLNDIIKRAFPPSERYGEKHPSKRTYQALRIEVNGELKILEQAIRDAAGLLEPGGRLAVMTFHSLEDRIVKNTLKDMATGCVCNKNIPVCVCGRKATMKLITHKPVTADEKELSENNRSKPAKLRVAEKKSKRGNKGNMKKTKTTKRKYLSPFTFCVSAVCVLLAAFVLNGYISLNELTLSSAGKKEGAGRAERPQFGAVR